MNGDEARVTLQANHDESRVEDLASRQTLTQEEVLTNVKELVKQLSDLKEYHEGLGMKLQKMIGTYYWDHQALREIIGNVMAEQGYHETTMKMIKKLNTLGVFKTDAIWFPTYYAYNTTWNFSDASPALAKSLAGADAVKMLTANLSHKGYLENIQTKNVNYVLKASLSILHNISHNPEVKHFFKEHKTAEALKPFFSLKDEMLTALAMLTMSYIVNEDDNSALIDDTGTIPCIIDWTEKALNNPKNRYNGFTPHELVQGLDKLAVNDSNKTKIASSRTLDLFHRMLKLNAVQDQLSASGILWTLAFDATVRQMIVDDVELVKTMELLRETDEPELKKNIDGIFWILREEQESVKRCQETVQRKTHVFISYCWKDQPTVLQIKDRLEKEGYKLWIDVECMRGSLLDAMADGLENAAIVLVCMSEKYKQRPNCRTEAEYMFQLRKEYIPVLMQTKYRPDGWLGLLLGAKLYIDFSGKTPFDKAIQGLVKELRGRGQLDRKANNDEFDGEARVSYPVGATRTTPAQATGPSTQPRPKVLTKDGIARWLLSSNLGHITSAFSSMDGKMLLQMVKLRKEAPEYFYKSLESNFKLTFNDVLRLMDALDKLDVD